ncbi:MAG: pilus assembly FimT family protein, partial [Dissulfurimicrobium sp.]
AILASIAVMGFNQWNERYTIERYTKESYAALMRARNDAMKQNINYIVNLTPNTMIIGPDADGDGNIDAGVATTTIQYANFPITYAANTMTFDRRGLLTIPPGQNQTICIFSQQNPAYNCIIISQTRINMGKINWGVACNATNCQAR